MTECKTLTELIALRKNEEYKGITFILSDKEEEYVSYKDLYYTSLKLLYHLQNSGYKHGDEIIFQIDDNQRFVYSFWACILGGMIPVPVSTGNNDEHKLKLFKIWNVLNNPRIIATVDFMEKLGNFAVKNGMNEKMKIIRERATYVEDSIQQESLGEIFPSNPNDIAFVQFSSGSTGDPKGVIITHSNVLTNLNSVIQWTGICSQDTSLNWMPLTHDMGLIGTHIKSIIACINQYNIQTQLFIRHPSLWIQKASEHKATLLYSPNFGYKHLLKFHQSGKDRNWDLSKVKMIYNGAEPISIELCNEFLDKMSEYGLSRNAMYPVYGLAEGTIAVTFPKPGEEFSFHTLNRNNLKAGETVINTTIEDKNSITFMDVGYPIYNCYVRISDEENNDIGENKIGYIQIRGGNVTSGYYNNAAATNQAISADGWLNTGDLGFMRNKRLVITGRAKDIIFIAGQNYYSHDIERIGECVEGVELGKIAAAGIFNEKLKCDELVLFVLFKQKVENFVPTAVGLKRAISEKMGIEVSEVIPVKNIPKTTSGKVQRYRLRESYIKGEYDSIKQTMHACTAEEFNKRKIDLPVNAYQEELVKIWSEILNIKLIGINDNFFELGGDSLKVTQLISRIRDTFGISLEQTFLFDNPDIKRLAAKIEILVQQNKGNFEKIEAITDKCDKIPLSFAQQRLWFMDRLNAKSPQYNLYAALAFKGILDKDALLKSFNTIIKRHKVLQMSFGEENGLPVQILNSGAEMNLKFIDLRNEPEIFRDKKARDLAEAEAKQCFDLEKAPLLRGSLLCMDENEHLLVLVVHHIVFDGWSFGILLKELNYDYETFKNNKGQELPELSIQYTDFAQYQIGCVQRDSIKAQLGYWKKQLGGKLPALELPIDKQRPAVQTYNGAKFTSIISGNLVRELQGYARKNNATLFMVLLSAFKVLLYRYTGQSDIVVGSPIANRNKKEIEDLIGFFTNNIVLRTSINGESDFATLLNQVKVNTLEAYSNQDVPFEKLVEELHVDRDMSRNPLFQVLFSLQNTPLPKMEFSDINVSSMDIDGGYSRFDMSLDIRDTGDGLAADFEYNTDLFNHDTIVRMSGHYKQLLNSIINSPDRTLDKLTILTKEENNILLNEWNNTAEDYSGISSWVELFEKQAQVMPENIAVVCGKYSLTYKELSEASNRLANYLIALGIGHESIVGVYVDRSVNMLVGLLGIHKAGAAYLPMDPIFPKERLAYMIEDAKVKIVLSEKNLQDTLPCQNAKIICLDTEWEKISECNAKPVCKSKPDNLAYLIYTSGSTGKPKGVQIEQFALTNFLLSMAKTTEINEKDSLLAVTTLSFDIAGLELYLPLIKGAKAVIAERDDVTDGSKLIEMLDSNKITMMQATPATWRLLIESGWTGNSELKVLCGGEALPRELANKLLDRCDVLLNVYGPTETTIWSTLTRIESHTVSISIGKPIANTQVYVLDKAMNPVPVGIPGELLIGGDGLARGYINLPELTREKFIPNPFVNKDGACMYKTGDLVKFTSGGSLEFVGRIDNQVKIRGFRIELGEIETLLSQETGIKECVVVAKEIIPGENSLVAYIIPQSGGREGLSSELLRKNLKENLPDYMVPAAYVILDSFPMTPNGKIDRKALPTPESLRAASNTNYAAPSNEIEKSITSIWQEVLKLERIGVNDNFFDLGGHSLLLAQVRSKIGKILNKEISMMELFKYPTISTLSRFLAGDGEVQTIDRAFRNYLNKTKNHDIAIIGLSGRFPGAKTVEEFWENLSNGVEAISRFTDEQVLEEGVPLEVLKKPEYVKAWGALSDIDKFDAQFFGYNPREAEVLDPQQRIFLEESWKALENAGYDSEKFGGLIGVYASVGMNTYVQNLREGNGSKGLANDYQIMISNDKDFLATRIAYKMNLEGPGVTVQTACSSSLVAVHLACQSLLNGECDMALAGGVSIRFPQQSGYLYQEGMILSPNGQCRAFDELAKGTVGGNGAGVVVLKRLEDAIADGDDISAVIKGSAINNDGALKIGYTAPRIDGQAKAIAEAQSRAGVEPDTITYIEAHGTGTPLGDPIEIEALTQVFNKKNDKKEFCAIGSVKTNIGHLDAAAGVTGLIKTVLALRNKKIPPSLNFEKPNPKINFKDSPFFVNTSLAEWENTSNPLRAGVSSFGIGGTNAHVVLEEAPVLYTKTSLNTKHLLIFSAKSIKALDRMTLEFKDYLRKNKEIDLADAAYTLQLGRREFEFRRFLLCTSVEDAIEAFENKDKANSRVFTGTQAQSAANSPATVTALEGCSLEQIGSMWLEGAKIDWIKLYKEHKRKRIPLPTYPFEGQVYWVKKNSSSENLKPVSKEVKRAELAEWFYTPIWKQSIEYSNYTEKDNANGKTSILVIADENSFSEVLVNTLKMQDVDVVAAISGNEYKKLDNNNFILNIDNSIHYDNLMRDLSNTGKIATKILNLIGITSGTNELKTEDSLQAGKRLFYSMMYLAQSLGSQTWTLPINIKAVTNNSQKIFSEKILYPEKALHLGACRVIPREYPNIACCSVDIVLPEPGSIEEQSIIEQLTEELYVNSEDTLIAYRGSERWKQEFEKIKLSEKSKHEIKLKQNGVYLITGGLGGIGLVLAEYLAHEVKAKLVLVGRSEFPESEQWDTWLAAHNKRDAISRKIMKLKQFMAQGAEILVCKADVTDIVQLMSIKEKVNSRFGEINGIIHAAGNPGGGMIQLKRKENAEQVLASKVQGTIALHDAFKDCGIDFYIFCSSLNAITGGFGQIDYSAANAYLDAFAQAHDSVRGTRFVSVDWDRWPGVGMASGAGQVATDQTEVHPLLGRCLSDDTEKVVYSGELTPEKDWVLAEHLVLGVPTIAGTTYLEMARAALEDITGISQVEIKEVLFLNPMAVSMHEKRNTYTIMNKNGNGFDFRIASRLGGEEGIWLEHARGKIEPATNSLDKIVQIDTLKNSCSTTTVYSAESNQKLSEEFISFGSRWRSLKNFSLGENEGLVEVELGKEHILDLDCYKLHPALLDVATGAVRLAAGGNYLPFSYKKLETNGKLTERIYGHIRFKNGYSVSQEIITCDIDILGENGACLVKISDFSMRLTGEAAAEGIKTRTAPAANLVDFSSIEKLLKTVSENKSGILNEGISSAEGKEAFKQILQGCWRTQIIVSTKDIKDAIEQANYFGQPNVKETLDEAAVVKERHPRPELENDYVPPKNETEKKLAELWQSTLSIHSVGIHDEFFALGGDSLLLIQLHTKLKENFETDIAVVDLYKYNTVALLAKYLSSDNTSEEQPAFEEVNTRVNKQLEFMKQRRQQMQRRKGVFTGE